MPPYLRKFLRRLFIFAVCKIAVFAIPEHPVFFPVRPDKRHVALPAFPVSPFKAKQHVTNEI